MRAFQFVCAIKICYLRPARKKIIALSASHIVLADTLGHRNETTLRAYRVKMQMSPGFTSAAKKYSVFV